MQVDFSRFPIVWMWFGRNNAILNSSPFAEFENLLSIKKKFVLLNDEGVDFNAKYEDSHENRKQTILWIKQHREALRTYVKASIYIETDKAKRLAAEPFAASSIKFWGYPMHIVQTEQEAIKISNELLYIDPV